MSISMTIYTKVKPIHPTVAAEFEVRGVTIDGQYLYVWVRDGLASVGCESLVECEKSALRHLRALPARR